MTTVEEEVVKTAADINITISEVDRWVAGVPTRDMEQHIEVLERSIVLLNYFKTQDIMSGEDLSHIDPAINKAQEFIKNA